MDKNGERKAAAGENGKLIEEREFAFTVDVKNALDLLKDYQFQDPHEAWRELVTNSIDSDASRIDVRVFKYGGKLNVEVKDDGCGISEKNITDLLTIGKSGKKGLEKIGRFGLGFYSLFNEDLYPQNVFLETASADERFTLLFDKDANPDVRRGGRLDKGTRVIFTARDSIFSYTDYAREVRDMITEYCQYSKTPIIVQGHQINKPLEIPHALIERKFDSGGIEGVVGLLPALYDRYVSVMAHRIVVSDPKPFNIPGVGYMVSSDSLDLVFSRNELIQDDAYQMMKNIVRSESKKLLDDATTQYNRNLDPRLRSALIEQMYRVVEERDDAAGSRRHWPFGSKPDPKEVFPYLYKANLFQFWGGDMTSLEKIGKLNKIVVTENPEKVEDPSGMIVQPFAIKKTDFREMGILKHVYNVKDLDKTRKRIDFEIKMPGFERLKRKDRYEFTPSKTTDVKDSDLTGLERNTIATTRELLKDPKVERTLRKYRVPTVVGIGFAKFPDQDSYTIAQYNRLTADMRINYGNSFVRQVLSDAMEDAWFYLLDTVGHELAHDPEGHHGYDFQMARRDIAKELRYAGMKRLLAQYNDRNRND